MQLRVLEKHEYLCEFETKFEKYFSSSGPSLDLIMKIPDKNSN
jgi:hypothetical protein